MGDEEWIGHTQETLGKLISKPKMTEKYLKKPPFRFLHDIVMEVVRSTNFAQGLYTTEECDAAQLSDKQAKVDFLNKAISVTCFALGEKIDVSANKIVAGLEADKTNQWLQKVHQAATTCVGAKSEEAVQRVLNGESMSAPKEKKKKKEEEHPPAEAKSSAAADDGGAAAADEEAKKKEEDKKRRADRKKREEEKKRAAEEAEAKAAAKATEKAAAEAAEAKAAADEQAAAAAKAPSPDAEADEEAAKREKKEEEKRKKEEDRKRREEKKRQQAEAEERQRQEAEAAAATAAAAAAAEEAERQRAAAEAAQAEHLADMPSAPGSAAQPTRPAAADHSRGGHDEAAAREAAMLAAQHGEGLPGEDDLLARAQQARPERPRTAGRRPPKVTSKVTTSNEQTGLTSNVQAPVIISEGAKDDDDEDLFEAPAQEGLGFGMLKADDGAQHGKLVSNLLAEQKKQEEKERIKKEEEETREEFEEGGGKGIRMGKLKRKKGESTQQVEVDIAALGGAIQSLCQAANPLGKSIDLVHQDIANMGKELDHWKQEYREASEQYQQQLKMTDELLQPLYQKVAELDDKIAEQRSKIRNSRSRISKNDLKIQGLLESVVCAK